MSYVNKVSGAHQTDAPPLFFGGILADAMGLGKSLTMIALILYGLGQQVGHDKQNEQNFEKHNLVSNSRTKPTLLIVPPSRKLFSITS